MNNYILLIFEDINKISNINESLTVIFCIPKTIVTFSDCGDRSG